MASCQIIPTTPVPIRCQITSSSMTNGYKPPSSKYLSWCHTHDHPRSVSKNRSLQRLFLKNPSRFSPCSIHIGTCFIAIWVMPSETMFEMVLWSTFWITSWKYSLFLSWWSLEPWYRNETHPKYSWKNSTRKNSTSRRSCWTTTQERTRLVNREETRSLSTRPSALGKHKEHHYH